MLLSTYNAMLAAFLQLADISVSRANWPLPYPAAAPRAESTSDGPAGSNQVAKYNPLFAKLTEAPNKRNLAAYGVAAFKALQDLPMMPGENNQEAPSRELLRPYELRRCLVS